MFNLQCQRKQTKFKAAMNIYSSGNKKPIYNVKKADEKLFTTSWLTNKGNSFLGWKCMKSHENRVWISVLEKNHLTILRPKLIVVDEEGYVLKYNDLLKMHLQKV